MIISLILGRKGSKGFPGKNYYKVKGKPLAWYPFQTSQSVKLLIKLIYQPMIQF